MPETSLKTTEYKAHAALLAVQLFFGTLPVIGKFVMLSVPPLGLTGFRIGGAALLFAGLQTFSKEGLRLEKSKDYLWFFLYSLLGVTINQIFFIGGLSLTTAVNTSLLAVLIPIFTFVLSIFRKHEKFSLIKFAGIVSAGIGVIYLINPAKADFSSSTVRGDILIIVNGFSYACYLAISKKLISRYGALKSMAWLFFFGSLITVPLGLYAMREVETAAVSPLVWAAIAAIIIFPTFSAYYLNAFALVRVSPSIVAFYIYLQPLIGFVSAVIFLNESFNMRVLIAAVFIFAGLLLVNFRSKSPEIHITN